MVRLAVACIIAATLAACAVDDREARYWQAAAIECESRHQKSHDGLFAAYWRERLKLQACERTRMKRYYQLRQCTEARTDD